MEISEKLKPILKYNRLAIASFVLGLMTLIFPIITIYYLITVNGGAGYLQSIVFGIPFTFTSIFTGIGSLAQMRQTHQKGIWMAILGIVVGILVFLILWVLVAILIAPYLMGVYL